MLNPHRTTRSLLIAVVLSAGFADYWEYSKAFHADPGTWMDVIDGRAAAPQQYRIGVPMVANLFRTIGHMGLRHGFAAVDVVSALIATFLLYNLFRRSSEYVTSGTLAQWLGSACFVLLLQYYLFWITWYQRPETLASAAMLAASLWLLTMSGGVRSEWISATALLVLAAAQAFIRADVIFVFHFGVVLTLLFRREARFPMRRPLQVATSVLAILISGGIQYYLMRVLYPHASYGATKVFQVVQNITSPLGIIPFVLFMLPVAWLAVRVVQAGSLPREGPSAAVMIAGMLYVAVWFMVGRIEEVRIFLPYAVALLPVTCGYALRYVLPEGSETAHVSSKLETGLPQP